MLSSSLFCCPAHHCHMYEGRNQAFLTTEILFQFVLYVFVHLKTTIIFNTGNMYFQLIYVCVLNNLLQVQPITLLRLHLQSVCNSFSEAWMENLSNNVTFVQIFCHCALSPNNMFLFIRDSIDWENIKPTLLGAGATLVWNFGEK